MNLEEIMKKNIIYLLFFYFIFNYAYSQNNCELPNWQNSYICVIAGGSANMEMAQNMAHGRSLALKTARILAYQKMAEKLKGVVLDSQATLTNGNLDHEQISTIVKATIRNVNFEKESVNFLSDGSPWAEVTISVPKFGDKSIHEKILKFENAKNVSAQAGDMSAIILDLRKLNYSPGLFPQIIGKSGKEIFSPKIFSTNRLKNGGFPIKLTKSMGKANQWLSDKNIFTLIPDSIDKNGNIVLGDSDAQTFVVQDLKHKIIENSNIVLVY